MFNFLRKKTIYKRYIITFCDDDFLSQIISLEKAIDECIEETEEKSSFEISAYNVNLQKILNDKVDSLLEKKSMWTTKKYPSKLLSEIPNNEIIKYLDLVIASPSLSLIKKSIYPQPSHKTV